MAAASAETQRDETEVERLDRNLNELLGELRVAVPGVQVLFAFLLVVPFNQRFTELNDLQETVYLAALLLTAAAAVLLTAPTARHRWTFRLQDKANLVRLANRYAILGLISLACGMTCAIALVTSFVFDDAVTAVTTVVAGAGFAVFWVLEPVRRRAVRHERNGVRPDPL